MADFNAQISNLWNWEISPSGYIGANGGKLKNDNFSASPSYSHAGALVTLSEGQSYGMLKAFMMNDYLTFNKCWKHLRDEHIMNSGKLPIAKDRSGTFNTEVDSMYDRNNNNFKDNGLTGLNLYGWVWAEDYSSAGGAQQGLASTYVAPDGEIVAAYALLLAYERWNVEEYKTFAIAMINDLCDYQVKQCGSKYIMQMSPYNGPGGFNVPAYITVNNSNVFADAWIFNAANFATGNKVKIDTDGTLPTPLTRWTSYYIRVNDPFNVSFYPTKADALADTNKISTMSGGSGNHTIYPFITENGIMATDPSYQWPSAYRLFAKYDTVNASIWNSVATEAYNMIAFSIANHSKRFPTYLVGVDRATGTYSKYLAASNGADYHPDAVRVILNMAFDGSTEAMNILKSWCTFNSGTGKWEPKTDGTGGLWGYYVRNGTMPNLFAYDLPDIGEFVAADVNTTNEEILDLSYGWDQALVGFTSTGTLPGGLANNVAYAVRSVGDPNYSIHTTKAGAAANTGKVNLTSGGSGNHTARRLFEFVPGNVNAATDVITYTTGLQTGDPIVFLPPSGSTLPGGLTAGTTYYLRAVDIYSFTVHTSQAGANANTGKVDITSTGSGTSGFYSTSPIVSYWGDPTNSYQPYFISPYGAAQILTIIYVLNGLADASAFYDSLPDRIKQNSGGTYASDYSDYYVHWPWNMALFMLAKQYHTYKNERSYLVFSGGAQSSNIASAQSVINAVNSTLGITNYGTYLLNQANNVDVAVPIVGKAWTALNTTQKNSLVSILPPGSWKVA